MQCTRCTEKQFTSAGRDRKQRQLYRCTACNRCITDRSGSAFSGYRFLDEVITLARALEHPQVLPERQEFTILL
jgi:transposase-like protein